MQVRRPLRRRRLAVPKARRQHLRAVRALATLGSSPLLGLQLSSRRVLLQVMVRLLPVAVSWRRRRPAAAVWLCEPMRRTRLGW